MRLFVGIDMPAAVKDEIAGLIERLRVTGVPDAKWVPRDNLHVTLSFLGEVREEGEIGPTLADAVASVRGPIPTAFDRSGAFPLARRARVLWVGLEDGEGRLVALANAVATALEPLGFPPEKRAWTPHLSLARFRVPANVSALVTEPVPALPFEVREATLFRSRMSRPAPVYEPLRRFPLGA
ncbi:MAG: RNA 2',3'-cyclic phosphodiesterase [Actinomycetota bacterium]